MHKFALITKVPKSIGRTRLKIEMEERGHVFDVITPSFTNLSSDSFQEIADNLSGYELVHFCGGYGRFVTAELQKILSDKGVICPNSYQKHSLSASNKVFQSVELTRAGLPLPLSIRSDNANFSELTQKLGSPFVVKEPEGAKGEGVCLISSEDELQRFCVPKKEYLFQEKIDYAADYRIHIAGNKSFCAYRRLPAKDDFRANISLGGSLGPIDESKIPDLERLALKAMESIQLDYGGVDIIEDLSGNFYILETNSDPGFKNVEEVTGQSFAAYIADYYESLIYN